MEYLDSLSEIVLVVTLISLSTTINNQKWLAKPYKTWMILGLGFISLTALLGAVRFAELDFALSDDVVWLHNLMSNLSSKYAMLVYATLLPVVLVSHFQKTSSSSFTQSLTKPLDANATHRVLSNDQQPTFTERRGDLDEIKIAAFSLKVLIVGIAVNAVLMILGVEYPSIVSDAFVFIGFVLFFMQARTKWLVGSSIAVILCVPLSAVLPLNSDISVALFHLLLAVHFELVRQAILKHKKTTNPAHLREFELQS